MHYSVHTQPAKVPPTQTACVRNQAKSPSLPARTDRQHSDGRTPASGLQGVSPVRLNYWLDARYEAVVAPCHCFGDLRPSTLSSVGRCTATAISQNVDISSGREISLAGQELSPSAALIDTSWSADWSADGTSAGSRISPRCRT
jgi:hypothetical protein